MSPVRATIRLSTHCDNACRFCGQHGTTAGDTADWHAQLVARRDAGANEVTFVGGEPLLAAALEPGIMAAASLGYGAIGVQTHGRALADQARVRSLVAAGLTDVHLSIHGARAAVHDYHTGVAGGFDQVTSGLGRLRGEGVSVVVTTLLTRSNARTLVELPAWLAHHGVLAWSIALPHAAGRAGLEFDRIMPRLALALPFALHALDRARKLGMAVAIMGAPGCLLGPWLAESIVEAPRCFAPVCEGCATKSVCAGIDGNYLARFGGDELRAQALLDTTVASMPANLRRMFVGPGERVAVAVTPHEPAAAARRRLPVLDRPVPGREETRNPQPSVEALFPALRDDD